MGGAIKYGPEVIDRWKDTPPVTSPGPPQSPAPDSKLLPSPPAKPPTATTPQDKSANEAQKQPTPDKNQSPEAQQEPSQELVPSDPAPADVETSVGPAPAAVLTPAEVDALSAEAKELADDMSKPLCRFGVEVDSYLKWVREEPHPTKLIAIARDIAGTKAGLRVLLSKIEGRLPEDSASGTLRASVDAVQKAVLLFGKATFDAQLMLSPALRRAQRYATAEGIAALTMLQATFRGYRNSCGRTASRELQTQIAMISETAARLVADDTLAQDLPERPDAASLAAPKIQAIDLTKPVDPALFGAVRAAAQSMFGVWKVLERNPSDN
jgi:hypothetical protein